MNFTKRLILFLIINFGGLALGGWLMANGPGSSWYLQLNQAPWTPPGWVFGFAWTSIMICFSIYLAFLFGQIKTMHLNLIYAFQVFLNVIWNYVFFNRHLIAIGLIVIVLLTFVIFYLFFRYKSEQMQQIRWLLMPYMLWLCIASSLNAYILIHN
ncbi:MAG: tryptophan-rich sensory protein [Flavobacteriaceae bacterium]|nr:tryptophan-rich sensory protein [Flavobacteriaceae bacterium]